MNQFSDAPAGGALTEQERQEEAARVAANNRAAAGLAKAAVVDVPEEVRSRGYRSFISPTHPNGKFLVRPGALVAFRDPNSPTGQRDARRDGDVYAIFSGGVLTTDDPAVIDWCEKHDGFHYDEKRDRRIDAICVDADDPRAQAYLELKKGQLNIATREPTLPQEYDVEQMVFPDRAGELRDSDQRKGGLIAAKPDSIVEAARRQAAEQNAR